MQLPTLDFAIFSFLANSEITKLRFLDFVSLVIYLIGIAAIGVYFARKNNTTEQYFLGNRSFPGWAIGLSLIGTSISSITFLGFPGKAFKSDWQQLVFNITLPLVAILAIVFFIPFFRRGRLVSAFEYLEERFGSLARLYAAISFIILQFIRLGTVLFLVSLLIHSIFPGVSMTSIIIATGLFVGLYTVIGGIEAVIWTDVIQSVVLVVGGLVCFIWISAKLPQGIPQIFDVANNSYTMIEGEYQTIDGKFVAVENKSSVETVDSKTKMFDFSSAFWVVFILGIFNWVAEYSSNQNVIQRYAASKTTQDAKKATLMCALMSVPIWIFFFFIGTCLFAFYSVFPDPAVMVADQTGQLALHMDTDKVFPHFLLTQIPAGIAGIIIAGVLAAAMSSLDSSINAISTVSVVDLMKRYLAKDREDKYYLISAKLIAAVSVIGMIAIALIYTQVERDSMNDLWIIMGSIFGGCMVGLFLLGFFTTRVHYSAAMIAITMAILMNLYLALGFTGILPKEIVLDVGKKWTGVVVNIVFVITAIVASFVVKSNSQKLDDLTVWTMSKQS